MSADVIVTQSAMRQALLQAAIDRLDAAGAGHPAIRQVVKASQRGSGLTKRKKMWSVQKRERST